MAEPSPPSWRTRTRTLDCSVPLVMGIVNVTPDSFSDGGVYTDPNAAVEHGLGMLSAGAHMLDVGGESTRPGAEPVEESVEVGRVLPVVRSLAAAGAVVSIDTMKPGVARAAIEAGAEIVNDVRGFRDPAMRSLAAEAGVGIVIMHMQGEPRTMQDAPAYDDVVAEVVADLAGQSELCARAGIAPESICLDPGIGFGKTTEHNLALIAGLGEVVALGYPVLVGASRKRFLHDILHIPVPSDRDLPTAVITALAIERGASVVRVHDAPASLHAARLARAIVVAGAMRRERQR